MSKKQRVERIFREKEVRHYIKPYIMYMPRILITIFNLIYDFKEVNRCFLPTFYPLLLDQRFQYNHYENTQACYSTC